LNNFRKHYPGDFDELMEEDRRESSPVKENNIEVAKREEEHMKIEEKEKVE